MIASNLRKTALCIHARGPLVTACAHVNLQRPRNLAKSRVPPVLPHKADFCWFYIRIFISQRGRSTRSRCTAAAAERAFAEIIFNSINEIAVLPGLFNQCSTREARLFWQFAKLIRSKRDPLLCIYIYIYVCVCVVHAHTHGYTCSRIARRVRRARVIWPKIK